MRRNLFRTMIITFLLIFVTVVIYFYQESVYLSAGIPVLNYHEVEDNVNNPLALSVEEFDAQMAYLHRNKYTAITPDQLWEYLNFGIALPKNPVLITFDDGYANNYTNAYPILKKYHFTATFFLITDVIGRDSWYMNWDQIKEMQESGFYFGSHTLSHVDLTKIPPDDALLQLVKSKEGIEWRLSTPVKYFAYPGGAYNPQVKQLLAQAGYTAAFSVKTGRVQKSSDPLELERIPIFKSRWSFLNFYIRLNFTKAIGKIKIFTHTI